jgi:mRNA interferase HigB
VAVNVISKRGLKELTETHKVDRDTREELHDWYRAAHASFWRGLSDVRIHFPSADQVGRVLIFDIRHNRYRLITLVVFPKQRLYVKALLTHKEYNRKEWMKWA